MTIPLALSQSQSFAALTFICQYDHGEVQKSAISHSSLQPPPSGMLIGTDSENVPSLIYFSHRVTICAKAKYSGDRDWESMKKEASSKAVIVDAKSCGVASETNQGMSLGLGK